MKPENALTEMSDISTTHAGQGVGFRLTTEGAARGPSDSATPAS
jgi:hypothetical protein